MMKQAALKPPERRLLTLLQFDDTLSSSMGPSCLISIVSAMMNDLSNNEGL